MDLKLNVLLGMIDKATAPLQSITGGSAKASKALRETRQRLRDLQQQQSDVSGYRATKTATLALGESWRQASARATALGKTIAATESPTRAQTREFAAAKREADKLGQQYRDNTGKLQAMRRNLAEAGINTRNLAQHERTLRSDITATNAALQTQQAKLKQVSEQQRRLGAARQAYDRTQATAGRLAGAGAATTAAGVAVSAPMLLAGRTSVDFQAQLRDMAITGDMSKSDEAGLGRSVRQNALRWNAATNQIGEGLSVLVANGITAVPALQTYGGLIAKTTVAANAASGDIGNLIYSLQTNLKIGAEDTAATLDALAYSGKQGSFELRDMAAWMPKLGPQMAALGAHGRAAAADLGAALQVARLGAGTSDDAANNLQNFLNKLTSNDARKQFEKAGVDLQAEMLKQTAKGVGPIEAMLNIVQAQIDKQGPAMQKKFAAIYKMADGADRNNALNAVAGNFAMGSLFTDAQVRAFLLPALANRSKYQDIRQGSMGAEGTLDRDWAKRMETSQQQLARFKIHATETAMVLGDALLPTVNRLLSRLSDMAGRFNAWSQKHPALVRTLALTAAGLGVVLTVVGSLSIAVAGLLGPLAMVRFSLATLGIRGGSMFGTIANLARGAGAAVAGISLPVLAIIAVIVAAALIVRKYWGPIAAWFQGVGQGISNAIGPVLADIGKALAPLKPAWDLVAAGIAKVWGWITRLLQPFEATKEQLEGARQNGVAFGEVLGTVLGGIIRAVSFGVRMFVALGEGIGNAAGFVATHWGPVGAWFGQLWGGITAAARGALDWISQKLEGVRAIIDRLTAAWRKLHGDTTSPGGQQPIQWIMPGDVERAHKIAEAIGRTPLASGGGGQGLIANQGSIKAGLGKQVHVAGDTVQVTVDARGMQPHEAKAAVRSALAEHERDKAARARSAYTDQD
jgi:TP901 family phage tail tape measure protein